MKKLIMIVIFLTGFIFLLGCGAPQTGSYIPGVYYAVDAQSHISVYINVNQEGAIDSVLFDQPYKLTTLNTLGDEYKLSNGHSWKDEVTFLASYLVLHQGWGDIKLDVTEISGMNSMTVPDYFAMIDYQASPSSLAYFTMPVDGFVLSWNLAIADASNNSQGIFEGVPTSEEWLIANKPPYTYIDGVYYGVDEQHGYIVRVVIEEGYIVDVVFDAITAINTRIIWNNNGTPGDASDDYPMVEIVSMTTKQALQEELVLISGTAWYVQAAMMRNAIIDKQVWDPEWEYDILNGHEYFDFTDSITIDAVAGVTLAIEGFRLTFEQAISKAILD